MTKINRTYETIFILDAVLEDDKLETIIQKYSGFLTRNGCSIIQVDNWGRKKFAYPINKKHSGHYVSIEFTGEAGIVSKLDKTYHLDDNIMRYLTISFDKRTLTEKQAYFEKKRMEIANKEKEAAALQEQAPEPAAEQNDSTQV
jgi:small subunit ribosomal protein S6